MSFHPDADAFLRAILDNLDDATPRLIFADWLEVDPAGYLVVQGETGSRIDGVFIAGDVRDHHYRQAVTAAADGCKAAIDAEHWLEARGIAKASTATAW